jgi:O-6-methylguanine DNA methyltransferase
LRNDPDDRDEGSKVRGAVPVGIMKTLTWLAVQVEGLDGCFRAGFTEKGLARLEFPRRGRVAEPAAPPSSRTRVWLRRTQAALTDALAGRRPKTIPPLDLGPATPFQREVWSVLREIPTGQTRTYGEVARAIGRPRAVRAVGQACGANPIPVLVPCHRVLATGGALGGFSAGLGWKRLLLQRERTRGFAA